MFQTQKLASQTLLAVLDGQNLTDALTRVWQHHPQLTPQQRGAIQDACYSTLRELELWRAVLKQLLRAPLKEVEIEALLLIALQQLHAARAASYAVVDHAVKVAAKTGKGQAKGLVNAVLRNFLRQQDELLAAARRTPAGRHNHPQWWVTQMRTSYPQDWQAVLDANNSHPPMTLRINLRHASVADYQALLAERGIESRILGQQALQLDKPVSVDSLPHFMDGWVSVQDLGAQYAALLLDVQDGQRVLDACAAPGGKTGHLLELARLELTALDNNPERLQRVADNLQRLQLSATLRCGDAAKPQQWWDGKPFDRILADVPCSASGVTRRHPDIKWLRRPEDFARFAAQQAQILDALWPLLAEGGKLLYATCSVFPVENADSAAEFAVRHPDARRLPLPEWAGTAGQLLPSPDHDGFYYALFSKETTQA
ncbi:16S rRNA (cytosine(967)-C(5))-methyltransferase RsmB [Chitinilyticum piscinae]|uniref:16S rRNA (cytosine(967)-C(5))-methyltransferase n=1 Tax=Chitinilyticum piscinae TaxID=2866724 RepID=A0A8J7KBV4_9NEIS|nr:16S rRNA (cytosine(967)-C(5))-methyltransferase RsmB [Chitinilyticum piscinae]MBE9610609.1 16S rRNA (cytosine(967)-C(5))-methyltransferase RsmB [Chitinilyticum piscinae]